MLRVPRAFLPRLLVAFGLGCLAAGIALGAVARLGADEPLASAADVPAGRAAPVAPLLALLAVAAVAAVALGLATATRGGSGRR